MDTIQVVYRDPDRTPLLFVIQEMARRHENLMVSIEQVRDAHAYEQGFLNGDFDLICEHLRFLFPARLEGHPVRCLAACQNASTDLLLAKPDINSIEELDGRTVAIRGMPSSQLMATYWLRHLGLEDRVRSLVISDEQVGRWQQWRSVVDGESDAVICSPLYVDAAQAAGLHVLDVPPLPEIGPLFFAALGPFLERQPDTVRRFVRALYRGLRTFKDDPATSLPIVAGEPARLIGLEGDAAVRRLYERLRGSYVRRPIPELAALATTFAVVQQAYPQIASMNPLTLWDLHYVLEVEESQFAHAKD
jgi:ABC-type nitrate/sulfonate/bicarbonate transport system substrate-binding protein